MRYETIKHLKDTDFKRLSGVQRETFEKMLEIINKGLRDFGRPTKLSRADQLLWSKFKRVVWMGASVIRLLTWIFYGTIPG